METQTLTKSTFTYSISSVVELIINHAAHPGTHIYRHTHPSSSIHRKQLQPTGWLPQSPAAHDELFFIEELSGAHLPRSLTDRLLYSAVDVQSRPLTQLRVMCRTCDAAVRPAEKKTEIA